MRESPDDTNTLTLLPAAEVLPGIQTLPRIQQDAQRGHLQTGGIGKIGTQHKLSEGKGREFGATAPRGDKGRTQGCERTWREPSNVLLGLSYKSRRACECKGNRQLGADRDKRIQAQVM